MLLGHKFEVSSSVGLQISGNRLKWKQLLSDLLAWFLHNYKCTYGNQLVEEHLLELHQINILQMIWTEMELDLSYLAESGVTHLPLGYPICWFAYQNIGSFSKLRQTRATFSQGVSIGPLVAATAWTFHSMALTKACELRVEDFTHWVYLLGVTTEMQHASCTTYPNPKRTDFAPFTHGWLENYDFT